MVVWNSAPHQWLVKRKRGGVHAAFAQCLAQGRHSRNVTDDHYCCVLSCFRFQTKDPWAWRVLSGGHWSLCSWLWFTVWPWLTKKILIIPISAPRTALDSHRNLQEQHRLCLQPLQMVDRGRLWIEHSLLPSNHLFGLGHVLSWGSSTQQRLPPRASGSTSSWWWAQGAGGLPGSITQSPWAGAPAPSDHGQ